MTTRRIENRRRIIASLRIEADRMEHEARDLRTKADRLELSTNELAQETTG